MSDPEEFKVQRSMFKVDRLYFYFETLNFELELLRPVGQPRCSVH